MPALVLLLALFMAGGAVFKPPRLRVADAGPHPMRLAARWFEEGYHADWRIVLRPDGRAEKWRQRKCLENHDPNSDPCATFKYEGTWDVAGRRLTLHLPGGMDERFTYVLAGRVLTLTDPRGRKMSFVYQILDAEGRARPRPLVGSWSQGGRTITLRADGSYSDRDDDGETTGNWRADRTYLTLAPKDGGDEMSFLYSAKIGVLTLQDATGHTRTLRGAP